jgi:hypothetical protein
MEKKLASRPDSARSAGEIRDDYARLMEHLNSIRGNVQVIKQKDAISAASQKVAKVWSQELKDIKTRGSKASLSSVTVVPTSTSTTPGQQSNGARGLMVYLLIKKPLIPIQMTGS